MKIERIVERTKTGYSALAVKYPVLYHRGQSGKTEIPHIGSGKSLF